MAVRGLGCPVRFTLTAGQKGDAPQADALIEGLPAEVVMADTAYDADRLRKAIAAKGALAVIPNNPSRALKYPLDKHLYAQRHLVECCFSKLKQFRRVATRFEKTARNYQAVVTLPPLSYGCDKCPQNLVLHRTRHLFIRQQTSVINAIRAHLAEFEIVAPVGRHGVEELLTVVADPNDKRVPEIARACLLALGAQLRRIKEQILEFDRLIRAWHRSNEMSMRLEEAPGVGPVLATALVAAVADPKSFRSGRNFSAWIGMVGERDGRNLSRPRDVRYSVAIGGGTDIAMASAAIDRSWKSLWPPGDCYPISESA